MELEKTIRIEALRCGLDTKINIFRIESGGYEAHVLRRRAGTIDWTLQWCSAAVAHLWKAESNGRGWHVANLHYFAEAVDETKAE